jgi:hypothetical protein
MISPLYKRAITVVYTPLFLIVMAIWITDVIFIEDNWVCSLCKDDAPTVAPMFIYFSMWSVWFTIAIFVTWAYFTPAAEERSSSVARNAEEESCRGHQISKVLAPIALPLVLTVTVTYIYYLQSNPKDETINEDLCYGMVRSAINRDVNESMANLYLVLSVITDFTIHYLSSPLLLALFFSGELPYEAAIPWSTFFVVLLGIMIVLVQENVGTVYCSDNIWVAVSGVCGFDFFFHLLFFLGARGKLGCKSWSCVRTNVRDDEEVQETRPNNEESQDLEMTAGSGIAGKVNP